MSATDKDLASGELVGSQTILPLFAGDAEIVTEEATLDTGNLAKYTVVGRLTATGKIVKHDPTVDPVDGSEKAIGVLTQAADATSADKRVAIYTAGFFNHEALVWHASLDTQAKRQKAFRDTTGHQVRIGSVRL
jgi:hypothetical protein